LHFREPSFPEVKNEHNKLQNKTTLSMDSPIQASCFSTLPAFWGLLAALVFAPASFADRTRLKRGMNMFRLIDGKPLKTQERKS
jgi:hypothetical protein